MLNECQNNILHHLLNKNSVLCGDFNIILI